MIGSILVGFSTGIVAAWYIPVLADRLSRRRSTDHHADDSGTFIHQSPLFSKSGTIPDRTDALNVIFVRHAESTNNVLAEEIRVQYGASPYQPETEAKKVYDHSRDEDPDLSLIGVRQLQNIPEHPYFRFIQLKRLASRKRVQIYCSPMLRALKTAKAVSSFIGIDNVKVTPSVCEKGGIFVTDDGTSILRDGLTRDEIQSMFPTFDLSYLPIGSEGWWRQYAQGIEGKEDDTFFETRLKETLELIDSHLERMQRDEEAEDYIVIVAHADFLNGILTRMLDVPIDFDKYMFYHGNTSCSHLEVSVFEEEKIIRLRTCNAQPKLITR